MVVDSDTERVRCSAEYLVNSSQNDDDNKFLRHQQAVKGSRKKFFRRWLGDSSNENPREYAAWKKRMILLVITFSGAIGATGTTLYLPGLRQIQLDLDASYTAVNASLALTSLVTAIFPLFWAAYGDVYGRKYPFLISLAITSASYVCSGLSPTVELLIVFRGLGAVGASASIAICAGIVTDLYDDKQQGGAYSTFTMGPLLGTSIGPIVGGRLIQAFGWRSTLFFMAGYAKIAWVLVLLLVPETSHRNNPSSCPENDKKRRNIKLLSALKLFSYPNVLVVCLISGISFFAHYFNLTAFTWIYTGQYNLDPGNVSLCYLVFPLGSITGNVVGGRLSDRTYKRRLEQAEVQDKETNYEMRLGYGTLATCYIVWLVCLSAFGWCIQKNVHFAYGIIFEFLVNVCCSSTTVVLATYLINSFARQSSSVNACNYFARFTLAAVGELFASDMLEAVPSGPLFTLISMLVFLSSFSLIYIKQNPHKWQQMREEREPFFA
ncbi:hypothetical protein VTP01DRAFT_9189 [Rhizomucor pusillus]|uniref:uncharacterized protein n=1 Tax=Rhizomucor pusillus TaxID=4840 RepID=UPI0037435AEB